MNHSHGWYKLDKLRQQSLHGGGWWRDSHRYDTGFLKTLTELLDEFMDVGSSATLLTESAVGMTMNG